MFLNNSRHDRLCTFRRDSLSFVAYIINKMIIIIIQYVCFALSRNSSFNFLSVFHYLRNEAVGETISEKKEQEEE